MAIAAALDAACAMPVAPQNSNSSADKSSSAQSFHDWGWLGLLGLIGLAGLRRNRDRDANYRDTASARRGV